jgi:lipid-A-disaccharide synthase
VQREKPQFAILTDSPDFHLRVAKRLLAWRIPVIYLVAPQVWAWRKGRVKLIRKVVSRLLCIFPFEERFFTENGVSARYIGHPLAAMVRPMLSKEEFFRKHAIPQNRLMVAILPGSRRGEAARHLPELIGAAERIAKEFSVHFILPASANTGAAFFRERIGTSSIQVLDGEAWDAISHADLALAASGTVTVEAALLGTPMVTFYRVNPVSWLLGKMLVRVPLYSMVNLIAEKRIVPELMQSDMTAERLSGEARRLLRDPELRSRMRRDLGEVAGKLAFEGSAISRAADEVESVMEARVV